MKSSNLVHWTRSSERILTHNGTDGNVPWATGNAWAPSIIERNDKYFFYFSGQNPTYDRKRIGVAVANTPEGSFTAQPEAMIPDNEEVVSGQAVDSDVFLDPKTGIYYVYWGNGNLVMAELAEDIVSLKRGTMQAVSGRTDFREASFLVYREPCYNSTISRTRSMIREARTNVLATPRQVTLLDRGLTAMWCCKKTPVRGTLATGHKSVVNVPGTDDWYLAYHRFAIPNGNGKHRHTTIDRVTFDPETGLNAVKANIDWTWPPDDRSMLGKLCMGCIEDLTNLQASFLPSHCY